MIIVLLRVYIFMKRLNGMEMNNGGSMTVEEYIYDMLKCLVQYCYAISINLIETKFCKKESFNTFNTITIVRLILVTF